MSISIHRVSLSFAQNSDDDLVTFTGGVVIGMGAPAFAAAPVPIATLTAAQADFEQKLAIAQNGGKTETATKNVSRAALIALLRRNAAFVQMEASTDLPLLLSSGYKATSTNRTSGPLSKPVIINVDNFQSTVLMVAAETDSRSRSQEARYRVGEGAYQPAGVHTKRSRIPFERLVPGTTYELQIRSVGGSEGYSDWSDPVSRMAT
jgi:hypothetical protein